MIHLNESAIVEIELEKLRNERPDPNLDDTLSKKSNFGGLVIKFFIGVLIFRAILEIISFFA